MGAVFPTDDRTRDALRSELKALRLMRSSTPSPKPTWMRLRTKRILRRLMRIGMERARHRRVA